MAAPETETFFNIRIVYKSGYTHDFEVTEFKIKDGSFSWVAADVAKKPLMLGADEVAAVWQLGARQVPTIKD
jgi:hypothetical protein